MKPLFFLLVMTYAVGALAQEPNIEVSKGNKAYREKNYEKAIQSYQEALKQKPNDPVAIFNLANALFRANNQEEASEKFEEAIDTRATPRLTADAWYNKGVSLTSQKKLEESIEAYKHALRINPADTLARENLLRSLRELKKKQDQQDEQKKKQQQEKKEQKQRPQPKMEDQRVQQLLQRLEEKEKQLQQKLNQQKVPSPGQPAKDW